MTIPGTLSPGKHLKQLANLITLSRILGVSIIFWLTPYKTNLWQLWAVTFYIFVCATDYLDGWVARRLNIVTNLGKMLDPLADKILILVFLPLLEMGAISSFPVFLILMREFAILGVRIVSVQDGIDISAQKAGKIKTVITLTVCGILFGRVPVTEVPNLPFFLVPLNALRRWVVTWPGWVFQALIILTVLVTIWSFLLYIDDFIWEQYLKRMGGDAGKAKRILRSIVPSTFSALNLGCGAGAMALAWYGWVDKAAFLVLAGMIFDSLDGKLARRLDAESVWGAKLDSKADITTFGIAPAMVVFKVIAAYPNPFHLPVFKILGFCLGCGYFAAVYYRLRRFDRDGHADWFEGLPSPVSAALLVVAAASSALGTPIVFVGFTIMLCALMISRIRYGHLDQASHHPTLRPLRWPTLTLVILSMIALLGIPFHAFFVPYDWLVAIGLIYVGSPLWVKT